MGREVRRVPKNWEHPLNENGNLRPLYDQDFESAAKAWRDGFLAWENGERQAIFRESGNDWEFWEYSGDPPERESYRPAWKDEDRTHYQMYETISEGTPISPVMESPEALARWLTDNEANAGFYNTATYDQWLAVCKSGCAPSMVFQGGKMMTGVEFIGRSAK